MELFNSFTFSGRRVRNLMFVLSIRNINKEVIVSSAHATPPLKGAQRDEQLIALRQQGFRNSEIIAKLGSPRKAITKRISRLIGQGRLERRSGGQPAIPLDRESGRFKAIVALTREGAILDEIGEALGGLSRERARQLRNKIIKIHGPEVLRPPEKRWTTAEAAGDLNVLSKTFWGIASELKLGRRQGRVRIFTRQDLDQIRAHLESRRRSICQVCGKEFFHDGSHPRIVCNEKTCQKKRRWLLSNTPVKPEELKGWRKELWDALREHVIRANERWLVRSEAARRAELSEMQFEYLRTKGFLTVRNHPTLVASRSGKPVRLYASSEIAIVRRLNEAQKAGR